jgi:HK97 family phage major capsid protein
MSGYDLADTIDNLGHAFEEFKAGHDARMTDVEKKVGRPLFGVETAAGPSTAERKALDRYLRRGDDTELKAMSVGSDADGGYAVTPALGPDILRVLRDVSPFHGLAGTVTISTDRYSLIQDRGTTAAGAGWVSETAARPATSAPQISVLDIPVREEYAMPELTQQLVDDNQFNLSEWLVNRVGEAFAEQEADAFYNGTGVSTPRGFMNYPTAAVADGTRAWGTLQHVATGVSGGFSATTPWAIFVDMIATLRPQYRQRATWLMSRATFAAVSKFVDTTNRPVVQPNVQAGQPMTIFGFPVVLDERMPGIGANSYPIALGDWQAGYLIVQRQEVRLLRDPYTNRPYIRFYTTRRVGGDVNDQNAIKMVKLA